MFCISILMSSEVMFYASVEHLDIQKVGHHSNQGPAFAVRDVVKDLVDLSRVVDRHRHGMRRHYRI